MDKKFLEQKKEKKSKKKATLSEFFWHKLISVLSFWLLVAVISMATVLILLFLLFFPLLLLLSPFCAGLVILVAHSPFQSPIVKFWEAFLVKTANARTFVSLRVNELIVWFYGGSCQGMNMNYGYATINKNGHSLLRLHAKDENERFSYQLYHRVGTAFGLFSSLIGKNVLDVSCGKGGGVKFILDYMQASKCIGVDSNPKFIEECESRVSNSEFMVADAENLGSLPKGFLGRVDVVMNIESSHCYGNFEKFVEEAKKIIKPGGFLLIADYFNAEDVPQVEQCFKNAKMVRNPQIHLRKGNRNCSKKRI